jgi:site-specific recombinase XerD
MEKSIGPKGLAEGTLKSYQSAIEQWQEFMYEQGRHPACPNQNHVLQWTYWLATERGNTGTTIHGKLILLNQMFKYFAGSRKKGVNLSVKEEAVERSDGCSESARPHGREGTPAGSIFA